MTLSIRKTFVGIAAALSMTAVGFSATSQSASAATYKKSADVSEFQGDIDWSKAAKDLDFVITRVQAGNPGDDDYHFDTKSSQNATGAKANNLPFGQYEYSEFTSVEDAKTEAKSFYKNSDKNAKFLVLDNESRATSDGNERDFVKAWAKQMRKLTNKPIVYYSGDNFARDNKIDFSDFNGNWIANYSIHPTTQVDLWQYNDSGSVNGIDGDVDMDLTLNSSIINSWLK
ncbi:GH25 family lysozyme [Levilactobacillus bambusae]|uniref:1,4-beta-N-acetylmuramidase n=1 Tax=Levilactobacillus bambusae TaxID=2024736 RepID=A0A2V1N188_9LACO|nr:GH25 family lysozyme [Levilactobacillus bambusae]PWG00155.1 1,4-beta-N-acetylmuramidase [Levilactobacillus bambusae]